MCVDDCLSIKHASSMFEDCKPCSTNADCPGDKKGCSFNGLCGECADPRMTLAKNSCKPAEEQLKELQARPVVVVQTQFLVSCTNSVWTKKLWRKIWASAKVALLTPTDLTLTEPRGTNVTFVGFVWRFAELAPVARSINCDSGYPSEPDNSRAEILRLRFFSEPLTNC